MAKPEKPDERLVYDVPEAGALLGLSRAMAYKAANAGEIPVIRFGKLMKVPKAAIDQMLATPNAPEPACKQIA